MNHRCLMWPGTVEPLPIGSVMRSSGYCSHCSITEEVEVIPVDLVIALAERSEGGSEWVDQLTETFHYLVGFGCALCDRVGVIVHSRDAFGFLRWTLLERDLLMPSA